jgi:hypothetical protein
MNTVTLVSYFSLGFAARNCRFKKILGNILGILGLPSVYMIAILKCGFNIFGIADTQHSTVIHTGNVIMPQAINDSSVVIVITFHVNLFNGFGNLLIFCCSGAYLP